MGGIDKKTAWVPALAAASNGSRTSSRNVSCSAIFSGVPLLPGTNPIFRRCIPSRLRKALTWLGLRWMPVICWRFVSVCKFSPPFRVSNCGVIRKESPWGIAFHEKQRPRSANKAISGKDFTLWLRSGCKLAERSRRQRVVCLLEIALLPSRCSD